MDFIDSIQAVDLENINTVVDLNTMIAVKKLLRRPWWTRLWVVEEALLAKELVFHCGRKEVTVEKFIRFQEESSRLRWDALPHLQALNNHVSGPLSVLLWSWEDYKTQYKEAVSA